MTCTATDKSGNMAECTFTVIIKAPKEKYQTHKLASQILQNITNQKLTSKLAVSDNITNIPELTVPVIKYRSRPSPPTVINDEILNMFKILIDDLK